ncbi:MAG: hypothetical protein KKF68_02910 [Nanoarchaeota archaeon]|nr:hypothetical protein [Nanoarchaeota archaeon]
MNLVSRTITGGLILLVGFWFIFFIGFIDGPGIDYVGIFVGFLFLILGSYIFLNKKEDNIEEIKSKGGKKKW